MLAPYVIPFARRHGRGFVFQDVTLGNIAQELSRITFSDESGLVTDRTRLRHSRDTCSKTYSSTEDPR